MNTRTIKDVTKQRRELTATFIELIATLPKEALDHLYHCALKDRNPLLDPIFPREVKDSFLAHNQLSTGDPNTWFEPFQRSAQTPLTEPHHPLARYFDHSPVQSFGAQDAQDSIAGRQHRQIIQEDKTIVQSQHIEFGQGQVPYSQVIRVPYPYQSVDLSRPRGIATEYQSYPPSDHFQIENVGQVRQFEGGEVGGYVSR